MSDENKKQNENEKEKEYSELLDNYSGEYLKEHESDSQEIPASRKERVEKFSLNFDADSEIPDEPEQASHDKGIYFAAYSPKEQPKSEPVQNEKKEPVKKKKKISLGKAEKIKETLRSYYHVLKKNTVAYTATYLSLILIASVCLSIYGLSCLNDIFAIRNSNEMVTVTVPENATTGDVIDVLHDAGLIKHTVFCRVYAFFMGYEDDYLNGMHQLNAKMGLEGMLLGTKEEKSGAETVDVTFPEGWTISQIAERLEEYKVCSADLFLQTLDEAQFNYDFLDTPLASTDRYRKLEGYFFPAQYNFYVNEAPASVVKKFFDAFNENVMTEENVARAEELGLTMDQVLTIASIIQREAANTAQMYQVSSVIHNRLNSNSFPALECEAVDVYYQNEILPNASTARADELFNGYSAYGTEGLPNGPICNPGADAIDAALHPDNSDYYFFCHDSKGNIYLARTQTEQNANWNKILSGDTDE